MDKQVQDSIQKFEDKQEFFEAKLKTRQSFREDQQALERRLSKYRDREKGVKKDNSVNVNTANNAEHKGVKKDNGVNVNTANNVEHKVLENGDERSKLESIVMDIQKDRERTLSETADKEDYDIQVPNDVIGVEDSENKNAKQNGFANGVGKSSSTENLIGVDDSKHDDTVNTSISTSSQSSVSNISTNGRPTSALSASANKSNSLPNGHIKSGSLTPEPRLKLRGGTRLYEKNSKLSASSIDHLDKISSRGGSRSAGHVNQTGTQMRKTKEQPVIIPVIPAIEVTSLPADGNLRDFRVEEMVSVFRMLHIPEKLVFRLAASRIDGKRFAMFSDRDLETLGIRNPVVKYFRDRSSGRTRVRKKVFML